jgi:hypothetical protein
LYRAVNSSPLFVQVGFFLWTQVLVFADGGEDDDGAWCRPLLSFWVRTQQTVIGGSGNRPWDDLRLIVAVDYANIKRIVLVMMMIHQMAHAVPIMIPYGPWGALLLVGLDITVPS